MALLCFSSSHLMAFVSCPPTCDFSHFHPTLSPLFRYIFFLFLSHSDRAPKLLIKHCNHTIVTMFLMPRLGWGFLMEAHKKNVFLGGQQKLTMRQEKSKHDTTRSCFSQGALGKSDQFCRDPSCLAPLPRLHFCFSSFFILSHSAVFLLSNLWPRIRLPTAETSQWHGRKAQAQSN